MRGTFCPTLYLSCKEAPTFSMVPMEIHASVKDGRMIEKAFENLKIRDQ